MLFLLWIFIAVSTYNHWNWNSLSTNCKTNDDFFFNNNKQKKMSDFIWVVTLTKIISGRIFRPSRLYDLKLYTSLILYQIYRENIAIKLTSWHAISSRTGGSIHLSYIYPPKCTLYLMYFILRLVTYIQIVKKE